jgi:hypothetical protein
MICFEAVTAGAVLRVCDVMRTREAGAGNGMTSMHSAAGCWSAAAVAQQP